MYIKYLLVAAFLVLASFSITVSPDAFAATKPTEPTFTASCFKISTNKYYVKVSWNSVSGASNYPIRLKNPFGVIKIIGNPPTNMYEGKDVGIAPTNNSYWFTNLPDSGVYTYWGHAWNEAGWSSYTMKTVLCGTVAASTTTTTTTTTVTSPTTTTVSTARVATSTVTTTPVSTNVSSTGLTLDNLWNGTAKFVPYQNLPWVNENPTSIQVSNGIWYAFGRKQVDDSAISGCSGLGVFVAQVRKSTDKGKTWSEPVVIADPRTTSGTPFCSYVDGDARYDALANKWVFITQCLSRNNGSPRWDLCSFSVSGSDPMKAFTANTGNPVVKSGTLWSQICPRSGSGCEGKTVLEEGTPRIELYKDGNYYVSFHGYSQSTGEGFRGMAKTADFKTWITSGSDLPSGAIFVKRDCSNTGCIGAGAGGLYSTTNYTYFFAETPTENLACTAGQSWPFTLYRSNSFTTKTGGWTSYPGNPLMSSTDPAACHLQYSKLIQDGSDLYLLGSYTWNNSNPVAIFKLDTNTSNTVTKIRFDTSLASTLDNLTRTPVTSAASTPNPTVLISVNPTSVVSGDTYSSLVYSSTNAYYCDVYKNGALVWKYAPLSKSGPPQAWNDPTKYTSDTTWTVKCYNTAGEVAEGSAKLSINRTQSGGEPQIVASCALSGNLYALNLTWNLTGATNYPMRIQGPSSASNASRVISDPLGPISVIGEGVAGDGAPTGNSFSFKNLVAGTYTYWGHSWTSPSTWSSYTKKNVTCGSTSAIPTPPKVLGATSDHGCAAIPYNLHRGHESVNVMTLQNFLHDRNFLLDSPTGFYGDKTIEAVKAYQGSKGIKATGMVYELTRAAIKADSCTQ
jgi:hypothetical protein